MNATASVLSVADLVTSDVLVVGMNQPAVEVQAALARRHARFAVVRQGTRVTAVVDRATLDRVAVVGSSDTLVRHVVHPGMVCVRADAAVTVAAWLMQRLDSGALPVVDEHHALLGIVTAGALAAHLPHAATDAGPETCTASPPAVGA